MIQETDFINYFYTNYVVERKTNVDVINKAYKLLHGVEPINNCNACVQSRLDKLKNTYISLIKVQPPKLIEKFTIDEFAEKLSSIPEEEIKELNMIVTGKNEYGTYGTIKNKKVK